MCVHARRPRAPLRGEAANFDERFGALAAPASRIGRPARASVLSRKRARMSSCASRLSKRYDASHSTIKHEPSWRLLRQRPLPKVPLDAEGRARRISVTSATDRASSSRRLARVDARTCEWVEGRKPSALPRFVGVPSVGYPNEPLCRALAVRAHRRRARSRAAAW